MNNSIIVKIKWADTWEAANKYIHISLIHGYQNLKLKLYIGTKIWIVE